MRRFGILVVVLALVLAGPSAFGADRRVAAQAATPPAMGARCPSPLATPTASPAASVMATPNPEPACVGVIEEEFYIRPDHTTFQVGQTYIFAVANEGRDLHEFIIEPAGSTEEAALEAEVNGEERDSEIEDIAPGQTVELAWTFTKPGDFQFACHIPGHYEAGMVIEVEVVDHAAAGLSAAERAYIDDMTSIVTTVRDSLDRYEELSQDPQFLNLDWLLKAAFEFMLWRSGYENALALEPPPAFAESHGRYLQALGHLAEISDDVAAAMDEGDLIGLMQIESKITRATSVFNQATDLMAGVVAERGG